MSARSHSAALIGYQLDDDPQLIDCEIFEVDDEAWQYLDRIVKRAVPEERRLPHQSIFSVFMRDLVEADFGEGLDRVDTATDA